MIYRVGDHAAKNMIHILSPKTVGAWRRTETGAGRLAAFQESTENVVLITRCQHRLT